MSIITDILPETVNIGGEEVPINWDYRIGIEYSQMMRYAPIEPDGDFLVSILKLWYGEFRGSIRADEAFNAISWFYSGGEQKEAQSGGKPLSQILDYDFDAPQIYAAFMSQYGIDLSRREKIHWWAFRALFEGLHADEYISKIMEYRSLTQSDFAKMSAEDRAFYRRQQRNYKLPEAKNEKDTAYEDAILSALAEGRSVDDIAYGKQS